MTEASKASVLVPTLEQASTVLAGEVERLDNLFVDSAAKTLELAEIEARLAGSETPADEVEVRGRPVPSLVARLLGKETPPAPPPREPVDRDADIHRHRELRDAIGALGTAIEIQQDVVEEAREAAREEISRALKPRHEALVRAMCERLLALRDAVREYDDFWNDMHRADVIADGVQNAKFSALGDPTDRYSLFAEYLHVCVRKGFWTRAEIPATLKLHSDPVP